MESTILELKSFHFPCNNLELEAYPCVPTIVEQKFMGFFVLLECVTIKLGKALCVLLTLLDSLEYLWEQRSLMKKRCMLHIFQKGHLCFAPANHIGIDICTSI